MAGAGPTIADEGLFSFGATEILHCLNPKTGELIWQKAVRADADREPPMWGFASSPLVHDGLVIVHACGKADKGLLAYDAKTNERKWSAPSGDHSYSSPQLATFEGVTGVLMETNLGLQFLDTKSDAEFWHYDWLVLTIEHFNPKLPATPF